LQSTEITMTQITQICPQCGDSFVLDARYCTHCGHDTALPAGQKLLPTLLGQAALPMLVGAASLAVSAGWQLLRHLLSRPASPPLASAPPRPRTTIRIRTSWVVGDASGNWRKGHSDQTIEID
jgi:hypothetical protein